MEVHYQRAYAATQRQTRGTDALMLFAIATVVKFE